MKRLTMSLDDELADAFDAIVSERGYENRSEAFRDLLRADIGRTQLNEKPDWPCIATLSYVYNHHQRQLAMRLSELQHEHHELTISTTHAHLSHDDCIEVVILRGQTRHIREFAKSVTTQAGVTHSSLHIVPMAVRHAHGHDHLEPVVASATHRRGKRSK